MTKITPQELSLQQISHFMVGLIMPRPIAWVSTKSADGIDNLAPFSFFNGVGSNPPALSFSSLNDRYGNKKDTHY